MRFRLQNKMQKIFYKTIKITDEYEITKIKWSRFIGNIFHVETKNDVENALQEAKKKYPDASHHCYAYRYEISPQKDIFNNTIFLAKQQKTFDDGEPTGTAGKPILQILEKQNLYNILLIVTRYFWGTLLGVGGLVKAYGDCAKETVNHAKIEETEITKTIEFSYSFDDIKTIKNICNKYHVTLLEEKYEEKIQIKIAINNWYFAAFAKEISDCSKGEIVLI